MAELVRDWRDWIKGPRGLPDKIDAKERGRDIAEAPTNEPRSTCTTIEIPAGHRGEALMTTTPRHRAISELRRAKAAPGPKHHRPARRFRPRLSGTIPRKGLASFSLSMARVMPSFM